MIDSTKVQTHCHKDSKNVSGSIYSFTSAPSYYFLCQPFKLQFAIEVSILLATKFVIKENIYLNTIVYKSMTLVLLNTIMYKSMTLTDNREIKMAITKTLIRLCKHIYYILL